MSEPPRRARADRAGRVALVALVLLLPLVAATVPVSGPKSFVLNLGPGDSPFIEGFTPEYEVVGTTRIHWTTKRAAIHLPLIVEGGPVAVDYRFARPLPGRAEVSVSLSDQPIDQFVFPGGRFRERRRELPVLAEAPVDLTIEVDAEAPEELGLRLDWVRVTLGDHASARLTWKARAALTVVPILLFSFFAAIGFRSDRAFLLAAPSALAIIVGLRTDPWLTFRMAAHLPAAIVVLGLGLIAVKRWPVISRALTPHETRVLLSLMMATFLVRAAAVNHPDFYHPDLRTHARFVETVRDGGVDFLRSPSEYILKHGVWKRQAYGREYAFPYSPAFHLPFVPFPLDYDALITVMPVVAAAWSIAPIAIVFWLARSVGLSLWGAALMAFVPSYMSRLSFVFMPSLFGHIFDVWLVCWLAVNLDRIGSPRVWWRGALLIACSQLAYTSGVLNTGAFIGLVLAALVVSAGREPRRWLPLLGMAAAASLVSLAVFYRDFLGMVVDVVARVVTSSEGTQSLYPIRSFWEVSYERTRTFFGLIYPFLSVFGLTLLWRRRGSARLVFAAWIASYFLLLLGRAKMPDLFLRGHEALFVTPLICLATGVALSWLEARGGTSRLAARALVVALAISGAYFQWRAIAAQLLPTVS